MSQVRVSGGETLVDPRGSRFVATITTVMLAVVLVNVPSVMATVLMAAQTVVYALGAFHGLRASPYGWLYRTLVRPWLGQPRELEEEGPPRFAQGVGFVFGAVALLGLLLGWNGLAVAALVMALVAAFTNAAFGYCLGCEVYLLLRRATTR